MKRNFISQREKKIVLKEKCSVTFLDIEKITHMTCEGYLTTIHTIEHDKINISKLLKQFSEELSEYGFIRANHNTLINANYISSMELGYKRAVLLSNNVIIKISRRKMCNFICIFQT